MSGITTIVDVPDVALENIFSFLSYDDIAKNRQVCKRFNEVGGCLLTRGFLRIEKRHSQIYKKMKGMLPRRESERRSHPMARNCDMLSAIETRLSMLTMTYMKYIESKSCCFIPGKVLDEVQRVLGMVESVEIPSRNHELLQELRDISSMAMEHFDEVISPKFKSVLKHPELWPGNQPMTINTMLEELKKATSQCKTLKQQLAYFTQNYNKIVPKFKLIHKQLRENTALISEQKQLIEEQSAKFREQEKSLTDLKKQVDEFDQKYMDLSSEVTRLREDMVSKTQTSPNMFVPHSSLLTPPVTPANKYTRTIIKPRQALPNYSDILDGRFTGDTRKRKCDSLIGLSPDTKIPRKSDQISNEITEKITKNITNNISQNITNSVNNPSLTERLGVSRIFSKSIETLIKFPMYNMSLRKRKRTDEHL